MLLHKRTFLLIFSLSVSLFAMSQVVWNGTQVKNWTGSGTLADPYLISTAEQLAGLADTVNKGYDFQGEYIRLTSDIYLSNLHDPDSLKHQWTPIAKIGYDQSQGAWNYTIDTLFFRGHFNGDGHTIFNLYYNQIPDFDIWGNVDDPLSGGGIDFTGWNKGLFGCLDSAVIENLYLDSAVVIGASTVGGIASLMYDGRISNCTVSGRVVSANSDVGGAAGGIVGQIQGGVIEQCISHVNVSGIRGVGSFVGQCLKGSTIRNSSSTGQAHCTQYHVGGFAGVNNGLIEQCYATGNVSRGYYSYASPSDCAGFVGRNEGTIKACYSPGYVTLSVR